MKANKLTVMRSMVRAVSGSLPGSLGASRSSDRGSGGGAGDDSDDGDDLGGLVYSQHEEVPETRFSAQLRRYRALVRMSMCVLMKSGRGCRGGKGGEGGVSCCCLRYVERARHSRE